MYTGNVWGIALIVGGFLAALIGFQLLLQAVFATLGARAAGELKRRPFFCFLVGTATLVAVGVASIVAFAIGAKLGGPGKFANGLVAAAVAIPLVAGLATVSRVVGERMPSPTDLGRPWRATLRGGVTTSLAFLIPVVGWFFVAPASLASGLGAVALGLRRPADAPTPAAETSLEMAA